MKADFNSFIDDDNEELTQIPEKKLCKTSPGGKENINLKDSQSNSNMEIEEPTQKPVFKDQPSDGRSNSQMKQTQLNFFKR